MQKEVSTAANIIKGGGVVAFPTETYYGLAADPFNRQALAKIYAIKQRPADKPLLTLIEDTAQLQCLIQDVPDAFWPLINKFWPGPLTLVFAGCAGLPDLLTCWRNTIAVRISSHPVAQALLKACASPLTATSANLTGLPAAASPGEVKAQLGANIDFVINGGITPGRNASTIIGFEHNRLKLIREGAISFADIGI